MRREYGRMLRTLADEALRASPFGWRPAKGTPPYLSGRERAYLKDADGIALWCIVVPHQSFESFTLEVGWSRLARFPELGMRPSATPPAESLSRDEYVVRVGELARGSDRWWEVVPFRAPTSVEEIAASLEPVSAEDARARVEPQLHDALQALREHGEPYLERAVAWRP